MSNKFKRKIAIGWLIIVTCSVTGTLFLVVPFDIVGSFFLIMAQGALIAAFLLSINWCVNQLSKS